MLFLPCCTAYVAANITYDANGNAIRLSSTAVLPSATVYDENGVAQESDGADAGANMSGLNDDEMDDILKLVESAADAPTVELDAAAAKTLILKFERAVNKNVEQREKYSGEPEKFLDSELALDESIASLQQLTAAPQLYPVLVDTNSVLSLLSLLSHENPDIAIAVINLLNELIDPEAISETDDESLPLKLIDSLLDNHLLTLLITSFDRFKEFEVKEDASAVYNILSIFENLCDLR